MKKTPLKRPGTGPSKASGDLKKPFGFCCEHKNQDPDTHYNMRNPPFKSSMADIFLNGGGPDLKLRVQEIGRPPYPIQWGGSSRPKGQAWLGDCKRCRGPLRWYLEDEISVAKDMMALDKQTKYNFDAERNTGIAIKKARKRRERKLQKKGKLKGKGKEKEEDNENEHESEKESDKEKGTKHPAKK